ncbi:MAG: nitrilase-related carbon-nitrogen hydrolase [Bacillota bacterium]
MRRTIDGAATDYLVAAVQFEPTIFDKKGNLERLETLVARAAEGGAKLCVLPEMATTGYVFSSREEVQELVEPVPGPTTSFFADLARRHGLHIVYGFPEVDPATDFYYNTAVLVGPGGDVLGRYRKTHSFINETVWARDGDLGPVVVETELGRIGLIICMDAAYFEPSRLEALAGADILAFPTNWLGPAPSLEWRARSLENGVYFVAADRWGTERGTKFAGGSCVIGPEGEVIGVLPTGDGLVFGRVSLARARDKRLAEVGHRLAIRRPEAYQRLVMNSYLWYYRHAFGHLPAGEVEVAVAQFDRPGDAPAAMREVLGGRAPGLIVFPELTDLVPPEPVPGPFSEEVRRLAAAHGTFIAYGAVEVEGGNRYLTAVLAGPEGLAGKYRMLHVAPGEPWAPGDLGLPVFDLPFGRVGLLLGRDLYVPEAARCLAKGGADLICVPAALARPGEDYLWEERATTNNTYVAVANRVGPGPGSAIYGRLERKKPGAEAHLAPGEAGAASLRLDIAHDSPVRQKEQLRKLQPFWYGPLAAAPGGPRRGRIQPPGSRVNPREES